MFIISFFHHKKYFLFLIPSTKQYIYIRDDTQTRPVTVLALFNTNVGIHRTRPLRIINQSRNNNQNRQNQRRRQQQPGTLNQPGSQQNNQQQNQLGRQGHQLNNEDMLKLIVNLPQQTASDPLIHQFFNGIQF
jgi:hypothetical protein